VSNQQISLSASIDFKSLSLRFLIVQSGDGGTQESGYIMNMKSGTSINMMKDGGRPRSCTIDNIPGIVKMFMKGLAQKVLNRAKSAFTCVRGSSGTDLFEAKLDNSTADFTVTDDYLWKELKAVSVDEDARTDVEMHFSSQAGGPTEVDLSPPTSWDCRPASSSMANADDDAVVGLALSTFYKHFSSILGGGPSSHDVNALQSMGALAGLGAVHV